MNCYFRRFGDVFSFGSKQKPTGSKERANNFSLALVLFLGQGEFFVQRAESKRRESSSSFSALSLIPNKRNSTNLVRSLVNWPVRRGAP